MPATRKTPTDPGSSLCDAFFVLHCPSRGEMMHASKGDPMSTFHLRLSDGRNKAVEFDASNEAELDAAVARIRRTWLGSPSERMAASARIAAWLDERLSRDHTPEQERSWRANAAHERFTLDSMPPLGLHLLDDDQWVSVRGSTWQHVVDMAAHCERLRAMFGRTAEALKEAAPAKPGLHLVR